MIPYTTAAVTKNVAITKLTLSNKAITAQLHQGYS